MITGGIDLAKLDLKSGIERVTYSVLVVGVAAIICAFTATTLRFNLGSFPDYTLALPIKLFLRFLASFVGSYLLAGNPGLNVFLKYGITYKESSVLLYFFPYS